MRVLKSQTIPTVPVPEQRLHLRPGFTVRHKSPNIFEGRGSSSAIRIIFTRAESGRSLFIPPPIQGIARLNAHVSSAHVY